MPAGSTAMSEPDRETRVATRRPPHHRDAPTPARARNGARGRRDLVVCDEAHKLSASVLPDEIQVHETLPPGGARPGDRRVGGDPTGGAASRSSRRRPRLRTSVPPRPRPRNDRRSPRRTRRASRADEQHADGVPPGAASRAPCKVLLHPVFQPLAGRMRSRQRGTIATGAARSGVTPPPRRRPGPGAF